jgi:predicted nucleic acid-binding OB-fold protein
MVCKVMKHTKAPGKKSSQHIAYDIAWDYAPFGESSIAYSYLMDACHIGSRIFTLLTVTTTSESQPELMEEVEELNEK